MKDLELFIAQMCHYAQGHVNPDLDRIHLEYMMECTSFQVACFLAQNTAEGGGGVEWEIVHKELCMPEKSIEEWQKIINRRAWDFGGWGASPQPTKETMVHDTRYLEGQVVAYSKLMEEKHGKTAQDWYQACMNFVIANRDWHELHRHDWHPFENYEELIENEYNKHI